MPPVITADDVQAIIDALPIQGRIMMRLLLLQYFDVTQEDIEYMAADRPDPRRQTGTQTPPHVRMSRDAIASVADRVAQYRRQVRLRRERTWLQVECLRKLCALCEAQADRAEHLLMTKFGLSQTAVKEIRQQARAALPKPAIRALEQKWENDEISEADYQKERLIIECQTQARLAERHRKRLDLSQREHVTANHTPLQDHEIAHIWGIPASSLAGRKVKYLHQYLQALQTRLQTSVSPLQQAGSPPLDLWKETLAALSQRPVERSVAVYDGLERTESALLEKLTAFAWGTLPEEIEGKFWLSLVHGASSNAVHSEPTRSLFGLQRLAAILSDIDASPEALDQELLTRTAPKPKVAVEQLEAPSEQAPFELGEMGQHVLKSLMGEDRG